MKRTIILAGVAILAAVSCAREMEIQPEQPEQKPSVTFTAFTEGSATKTTLEKDGDNYNVNWQSGDQITIVDGAGTPNVGIYSTTSTTAEGDFSFVSGAEATDPDYRAWYPATVYNAGAPTLPATQAYAAGNITGAPMYAESSTTSLAFKNLCGIIRLNISTTQTGKKVRRIVLSANEGMSGAISNATSLASGSYVAAVSGTAGVELDCGESGVAIGTEAVSFHLAVPQNTYTGLKITVVTTDGDVQVRTAKSGINVGRSSIVNITLGFNGLSSLVQHWPFDDDAKNAVPGGVDAIVTGASLTTDRFGNENGAYYFDGNDKMVAAGAALFGKTSFTANIWVNSTQTSGLGNIMRTDGGYYPGWLLRFNGGRIEIWEGRSSNYGVISTASFADGNWHMLTYVRDVENKVGLLYVDGSYVCGYTMTSAINDDNQTELRFGTYGEGEYYIGKMDDARLYNKALSAEEVSALYNETASISATASKQIRYFANMAHPECDNTEFYPNFENLRNLLKFRARL